MPAANFIPWPFRNLARAVVCTALLAGTLDGLAAIINYSLQGGKDPGIIFRYIASGLLGKSALEGGTGVLGLGVLFHYAIAFSFTAFFFWLKPKIHWLATQPLLAGVQYGIFVWVLMNLFIVPFSRISKETLVIHKARIEMLILILCIGIPVSLMADKYYLYKK